MTVSLPSLWCFAIVIVCMGSTRSCDARTSCTVVRPSREQGFRLCPVDYCSDTAGEECLDVLFGDKI